MMDAIILTGGMGKRLRPLTNEIPKCLVPVNGKPLLEYQIEHLKKYDVNKIILACGYKWEKIKEKYGNDFIYSVENEPLGTGGAIKKALNCVEGQEFFVLNCDDFSDVDWNKLKEMGSNCITLGRFKCRFGVVDVEEDKVVGFRQYPLLPYWANIGHYLFNKNIPLPDKGAIETETFPELAVKKELKAYKHNGIWITVNTMKQLEELEKFLKGG